MIIYIYIHSFGRASSQEGTQPQPAETGGRGGPPDTEAARGAAVLTPIW